MLSRNISAWYFSGAIERESTKFIRREKLKALDIADVYDDYQRTVLGNNFRETGDIYSSLEREG